MKNKLYTFLFIGLTLFLYSCDEDFESINVDPTTASQINVGYKFPSAVLYAAGQRYESWRGNLIYASTMIQHLANTQGYWNGDKYTYSAGYAEAFWTAQYPQTIKSIEDMMYQLEEAGDTLSADYGMVRVLRVFAYHRMTDLYGDIPYSEAGKAYTEGAMRPAYDPQEEIYADMLKELEESAELLDGSTSSSMTTADIIYNGDVSKWQKWAYSLMLRLGLRMTKVDEAAAQEWVEKAIAGGVMESNDDIAYVQHEEGNGILQNGNGEVFTADSSPRMSNTFIQFLQGDPRLTIYASLPATTGENTPRTIEERLDPDAQLGLPNGLDSSLLQDLTGETNTQAYSEPNRLYITSEAAPIFFQTYAEVEFMLAEAAYRWGSGDGDVEAHYEAGVTAAMKYLALYSPEAAISDGDIDTYLEENPYDPNNALEQINTQYWAAIFLNEYEAYANWRRTGFPILDPVDYPGNVTGGTIPRRLTYLQSEQLTNTENYDAAVASQGPDDLTTRVWWDVEQ